MAGIERGTPDVSIAREMDTPLHRVLLSGLVYARARLTAGPWLNRHAEKHIRFAARVGVYANIVYTKCSPRPVLHLSAGFRVNTMES